MGEPLSGYRSLSKHTHASNVTPPTYPPVTNRTIIDVVAEDTRAIISLCITFRRYSVYHSDTYPHFLFSHLDKDSSHMAVAARTRGSKDA